MCEGAQELLVMSVASGDGEFLEEPGDAEVEDAVAVAAGLVAERAGEVALAGAGGSGDDDVVALAYPVACGQGQHEGLVESARVAVVDVLDGGGLAEPGALEAGLDAAVFAFGVLGVHEHAEAFIEGERVAIGHFHLFDECALHAGQFEGLEFVERGVNEHRVGSPFCFIRGLGNSPPRARSRARWAACSRGNRARVSGRVRFRGWT